MKDFFEFDPKKYIQRMDTPEKHTEVYQVFADFVRVNVETPTHVLDVASGPGVLGCMLSELWRDAEIIGIDISQEMVDYARKRAERFGCKNLKFICGDARNLQFPDEHFDVIVCRGFLKVVPEVENVVKECWRVLRPGGKMFFSDTYYEGLSVLPAICKNEAEYQILEEAVKHSLNLSKIKTLFSPYPSSIFLRGISAYIVCVKSSRS